MVMVMEVVKIDSQGRVLVPKALRERLGLTDEIELIQVKDGILLRSRKLKTWQQILSEKLKVDWKQAMAISLEGVSMDDLLFG
jgi:AbrB family looped-hinge helix DNA binding protein